MKKKINILDCTFRDGGYYNNWNFPKSIVKSYVKAINNLDIDVVEIGFRFLAKKNIMAFLLTYPMNILIN